MPPSSHPAPPARPDPDRLLEQLRDTADEPRRGRLRIYLGASAGVGKTFAMLGAAQRARAAGQDVLAGVVETHGRADTAALLEGLPRLAPRVLSHRGHALEEFDLDAALARRPRILLVDELAHANAPGSRHPKRWQDVQELLAAGIEVWSALNVQHLESLNGTVGAITGVRVQETVPDTVLDQADDVVLVDVTADELLARLAAGKVYLPQQAGHAARNFFRKGNLIALREIALRRTAEHVEDDMRHWRVEQSGRPEGAARPAAGAILVAVGPGESADHAVRSAARLAGQLNLRWHAAYVETPRLARLPAARRDRILATLHLAQELGAGTAVLSGADVAPALAAHAREIDAGLLVLGRRQRERAWLPRCGPSLSTRLARLAPQLDRIETAAPALRAKVSAASAAEDATAPSHQAWARHAWAALVCAATGLVVFPLATLLDQANIVMLFLLSVVLVALRLGRGPAALAALLNVAVFDFFFVQPRFSFAVSDVQYLVTFAVMLGVGLLVGQMTAGLRAAARVAAGRERRAQALFDLTRELSAALEASQVAELGAAAVQRTFGGAARVLVIGDDDRLDPAAPGGAGDGFDADVADWALRNGQHAGLATHTLGASAWHYVPLQAPMRVRGVLALKPAQPRWLRIPEQMRQLETLARQIAIALERVHYVDVARQALVQMESEQLRNTLLAAISHDVRTPLTALIGLAETLRAGPPALAPGQARLAQAIERQARELNVLVTNLLELARLQSGGVRLRSEWQSVEEVVGAAIRAARPALAGREVRTAIAADLPLVEFDAVLIERLLVNLLENAARHGAPPIELTAQALPDALRLVVRDHGPGLGAAWRGREDALFDKFTRGQSESATPGAGLGLAICKAVALAHGGRIRAADAAGGGAEFTLELPRREPPAAPPEPVPAPS